MIGPLVPRPAEILFKKPWLVQGISLMVLGSSNLQQGRSLDLSIVALSLGAAVVLMSLFWRKTLVVDAARLSYGSSTQSSWDQAEMNGDKLFASGRTIDLSGAIWPTDENLAAWRAKQGAESLGLAYRAQGAGEWFRYASKMRRLASPLLISLAVLLLALVAPSGLKIPTAAAALLFPLLVAIWNSRRSPRDLEIKLTSPSTAIIRHQGVERAATIEKTIGSVESFDFLGFREIWRTDDRRFEIDPRALEPNLGAEG